MTDDDPGTSAWKEHTSSFDRVRSIAVALTEPRAAGWIAGESLVAENTARDHLSRLVEMNVLQTVPGEQATRYRPDPLYTRMRTLRELLDSRDRDALLELRAAHQDQLEAWRSEYGVGSVDELRERAAHVETAAETRALRRVAGEWEIVQYRLGLIEDAIEHYSEYAGSAPASA